MISILAMKSIFLIWHSIVCHDALSFKTSTHHLVQKIEVFKKGWEIGMSGKDFFWKKRNFLNCLDFFFLRVMGKFTITSQSFLHEMQSIYIRKFFSRQLLLRYLNNYFLIKRINTLCDLWFIEYVFEDNKTQTQISVLLIVDNNNTQREQVKYSVYYLCSILERHNLCF